MSFAKNQEEEVTSVPGVRYTEDTEGDNANGDSGNGAAGGGGRKGRAPPHSPQSMDVEMGSLRGTHSRVGGSSWAKQGGSASLV